jgi:hypothetical protein
MTTMICKKCSRELPADKASFVMYRQAGVERLKPECRECNRKVSSDYKAQNRVKIAAYNSVYKAAHTAETTAYNRDYFAKRRQEPEFRIKARNRSRISDLLRGKTRASSETLLGCTYQQFIVWLSYQFDNHMTMDNYGSYWHLDHVIPCASFDFNDKTQQRKCFHWTNYSPCEGKENILKSDTIDPHAISWQASMVEEFLEQHNYNMEYSPFGACHSTKVQQ